MWDCDEPNYDDTVFNNATLETNATCYELTENGCYTSLNDLEEYFEFSHLEDDIMVKTICPCSCWEFMIKGTKL